MKKIISAIMCLVVFQLSANASSYVDKQLKSTKKNIEYNTVKTNTAKYDIKSENKKIKDPHLILLSTVKPVDKAEYNAKLKKDEEIYKKKIQKGVFSKTENVNTQPYGKDFYNIYRITERIIRANKLDYMNWRVAVNKSATNFNAASTEGNLIIINTALYDSFAGNDDALAFVIGHEIAHSVYGDLKQDEKSLKRYGVYSHIRGKYSISKEIWKLNIMKTMREQEYKADIEGAIFMTRAGYDMEKGMDALNFMNTLPVYDYELFTSHPEAQKRIDSMNANRELFSPEWVNEGEYNILNSTVLPCKKSSDRVSIVIDKNPKAKDFFEPETYEEKLIRVAYMNYRNANMEEAIKYFKQLADMKQDYVVCLYISYANEYLYNQTNNSKYLNEAIKYAKKANSLNQNNQYVEQQLTDLVKL